MIDRIECLGTDIRFADDFEKLSYEIGELGGQVLWVCDTNTARMVRPLPDPHVIVEVGEGAKTIGNLERIIQTALENNFSKNSTFLALGGGTVCDLTALAASLYLKGCHLTLVPTTLLAMADAAIGGSTSINYKGTKSILGTHYPADRVIICRDCLKSLSAYEFNNGLSIIIRNGLLTEDEYLLKTLVAKMPKVNERDPFVIKDIIKSSIIAKKEFCEKDEDGVTHDFYSEFGMTFSNAFECLSHLQCSHGQAVAWGVCRALEASVETGLLDPATYRNIRQLYTTYGYKTDYRVNRGDWLEFKKHLFSDDKRTTSPSFVLLKSPGVCERSTLDEQIIRKLVLREAVS